jgi:hypothetical protein
MSYLVNIYRRKDGDDESIPKVAITERKEDGVVNPIRISWVFFLISLSRVGNLGICKEAILVFTDKN